MDKIHNIKILNQVALSMIEDDSFYCRMEGIPHTRQEIEEVIINEAKDFSFASVPFLPLERLNSKLERKECLNIIESIIETGKFTSGPYIEKLEEFLSSFYNASVCVVTSSGTEAIQIALKACGVGEGDEVILPSNSFAATENAIFAVGAIPIFINNDFSYNMDFSQVKELISNKTKAILPVCLYGSCFNMENIYNIGKAYKLKVIIDAAQCFGISEIQNFSDFVCLSFNPFKNLGGFGKSGALICKDKMLGDLARQYSYHGFSEGKKNIKSIDWGYNGRMDNMQAAILMTKLKFFNVNALKRCYLAHRYMKELFKLEMLGYITLPKERVLNTWHLFPLYINKGDVNELIAYAKQKGIEFDIYYPILSHQYNNNYAKNYQQRVCLKESEVIHAKILNIPLHNHMAIVEQNKILEIIYEYFK